MDTWFIILYLNVQRMPLRVKRKRQDLKQKKICRSIWKKFGRKLKKKKREICKDKQILMISRFYKPAFVIIIVFFGHIINKREEKMQEKFIWLLEKLEI